MNSLPNDNFKRSVSISELTLAKPQLIHVTGFIENQGNRSWINGENGSQFFDVFGYRLISPKGDFPIIEKLLPLQKPSIAIGEKAFFDWYIPIPQLSSSIVLEIDLLFFKDNFHWYSSLGATPASVEMDIAHELKTPPAYQAYYSSVLLRPEGGNFSLVSGTVLNSGTSAWNNQNDHDVFLGFRILDPQSFDTCLIEGRGKLELPVVNPGEQTQFSARIPNFYLKEPYILKLSLLKEREFWFDEVGVSSYLIDLAQTKQTLKKSPTDYQPYRAVFKITHCSISHEFLLNLSGTLQNSGLMTWNPKGFNRLEPIRVGLIICNAEGNEPLKEDRTELPSLPIEPGTEIPFSMTTSLLGIPSGKHIVILDVVYETKFWFSVQSNFQYRIGVDLPETIQLFKSKKVDDSVLYPLPTKTEGLNVLFLSPVLPLFDLQAGGKRLYELLKIFKSLGCSLDFIYESSSTIENAEKYKQALSLIGVAHEEDIFAFFSKQLEKEYQVCIIAWHQCAQRYLPMVRALMPRTKIIIDTVDIHWVREARGAAQGELSFTPEQLEKRKEAEGSIYDQADLVWVVSEDDKNAALDYNPSIQCQIVPLIYHDRPHFSRNYDQQNILFLGGFRHPPNIAAAKRGADIIKEFNAHREQPVHYSIVGELPPAEIQALDADPNITVTGFVDDLTPFLDGARALLAPLGSGAGMKGKICDAIYARLPVITNAIGAEGLELTNSKEFFYAQSNEDFIAALTKTFAAETDLQTMTNLAYAKVSRLTSSASIAKTVRSSIAYRPVVLAIVTYNKANLLKQCLDSIFEKTSYPLMKVCVFSNGCTDNTMPLLHSYQRHYPGMIDIMRSEENLFFVKPNNQIIGAYPDHDVVMINNDIEIVTNNWLTHLYHAAYSSPFIAAAGCLILDPQGKVSEAGAKIDRNGYGFNLGRGSNPSNSALLRTRYVGFCSGCLLYLRRDAIQSCGLLDEEFHPMYYEDAEWQYRAHALGLKTIYVPRCRVIHHEGSSAGTDINQGLKRYQEVNRLKFLNKVAIATIEELN